MVYILRNHLAPKLNAPNFPEGKWNHWAKTGLGLKAGFFTICIAAKKLMLVIITERLYHFHILQITILSTESLQNNIKVFI